MALLLINLVSLKLTPLRVANVPPPMSLHTLALLRKPVDVAISKAGNLMAVLSDYDIAIYSLGIDKRPLPKPSLLWRSDAIKDHCPRHVSFIGDDQIYVLTDRWDEQRSYLWRREGEELLTQGPIMEVESVSLLTSSVDLDTLYLQSQNGALHKVSTDEANAELLRTSLINKFPSFSAESQIIDIEGQVGYIIPMVCIMWLTVLDPRLWSHEDRHTVCKRPHFGSKLHIFCSKPGSSHFHNFSASLKVRTPYWCRGYDNVREDRFTHC